MAAPRTPSPDVSAIRPGQLIGGRYRLLEPLGAGGMGQIWTARSLATSEDVAIKLLHAKKTAPDAIARFRREAHATAQLAHPGIVRVLDIVELPGADGSIAMVMERLRGRSLAELLQAVGPLTAQATANVVVPILHALHHAHQFGIIHRDLKPENVFLSLEPDGQVVPKLLDFGISKILHDGNPQITGDGHIVGTPSYMSPEQVRGDPIDARSDVFCAGILLYVCLTGRNPFAPDDTIRAVLAVLEADPVRPEHMPLPLWRMLERALAKRPGDRFLTALDLADALSDSVPGETERADEQSSADVTLTETRLLPPGIRRRTIGVAIAACVALLWLVIAMGSTYAAR